MALQPLCTHTGQHKYRINAHRHPCLEGDLNPRSQCSSGRRQIMLQTAWPLWSARSTALDTDTIVNEPQVENAWGRIAKKDKTSQITPREPKVSQNRTLEPPSEGTVTMQKSKDQSRWKISEDQSNGFSTSFSYRWLGLDISFAFFILFLSFILLSYLSFLSCGSSLFFFVYGLFNNALSSSDCTAPTDERWAGSDTERSGCCLMYNVKVKLSLC
jgi:hypothetical protein